MVAVAQTRTMGNRRARNLRHVGIWTGIGGILEYAFAKQVYAFDGRIQHVDPGGIFTAVRTHFQRL